MFRYFIKISVLLAVILIASVHESLGEDFRVENRIFVENKTEPESRSLTLFHDGMVYDFMSDPSEATLFDKATGRFYLLSMAAQEQTEIAFADIEAFTKNIKRLADKQKDASIKFFADPKFKEEFDATSGELTLSGPWATYRISTKTVKTPAILGQYRDFSDWQAQLNAMLNPGSRPPQARLQVNEALARREVLASEVNLTITTMKDNALQKTSLRSEHDFAFELTPSDLEQIKNAQNARSKFKSLPYEKYEKNRKAAR